MLLVRGQRRASSRANRGCGLGWFSRMRGQNAARTTRGFHAALATAVQLTSHVSPLIDCQAASFPASQSVQCPLQMFQPTDASALASGPHPLTQRINEDQAVLEFPGKMYGVSVCTHMHSALCNSQSYGGVDVAIPIHTA